MKHLKRIFFILIPILLFIPLNVFADPNFDGNWKLNKKDSDDPRKKFEEARKNDSGDHREMGDHPSYGGGGFHNGHHGGGERMHDRMQAQEELSIHYKSPEFRVTDKEGKERIYYTDGRETVIEGREGRSLKATAKAENEQIIIESSTRDGGEMTESYYLSPDATQLYVKVRMKPLMLNDAVTFVRVYDRNPPQKENQSPSL
jgi:hypothetical protein